MHFFVFLFGEDILNQKSTNSLCTFILSCRTTYRLSSKWKVFSETVRYEEFAIVIDLLLGNVTKQCCFSRLFISFHNYVSQLFSSGSHSSLSHFTLNILRNFLSSALIALFAFFSIFPVKGYRNVLGCTPAAAYVPASWQYDDRNTFNTEWYFTNRWLKTKSKCKVNIYLSTYVYMYIYICIYIYIYVYIYISSQVNRSHLTLS